MTTYYLTVNIEPDILVTLINMGYNLCFAMNVDNEYNVAALTIASDELSYTNDISWTTSYTIAGTQQPFQAGNVVEKGRAPALPIDIGQIYELISWDEAVIINREPGGSIGFITRVDAAALISLNIANISPTDPSPIYISPFAIPVSSSFFTPIPKAALWFQGNLDTSTMIVLNLNQCHVIDFSNQETIIITFKNDGTWQDGSSGQIDYTQVAPAYLGKKHYLKHKHEHEHKDKKSVV